MATNTQAKKRKGGGGLFVGGVRTAGAFAAEVLRCKYRPRNWRTAGGDHGKGVGTDEKRPSHDG